jgi:hypothetical protein
MVIMAAASLAGSKFLNYQGLLEKADGTPVTTAVDVTFRIYESESAATDMWSEDHLAVLPNSKGRFHVRLGETNIFLDTVFNGNDRWLGIKVGVDAEMTPRTLLGSVPVALMAHTVADTALGSSKIKRALS